MEHSRYDVFFIVECVGCVWRAQTHQDLLAHVDI